MLPSNFKKLKYEKIIISKIFFGLKLSNEKYQKIFSYQVLNDLL